MALTPTGVTYSTVPTASTSIPTPASGGATPTAGGLGVGAQLGGAVAGVIISSIIGGAFAKEDAGKQRELTERLEKLSLAQQKEIAERFQNIQSEIERQNLVYQYLAVQQHNEALLKIQNKRYTSYAILGVGAFALIFVMFKLIQKKNG
jgi:hypothetical protein